MVVRRPGKSLLTWLLAVMVGGMSLLGEELHDLLGLHQGLVSERCPREFFYGCSSGADIAAADHHEGCHDASTCPVCQYLAQGKVLGERFQAILVAVSVASRSPVTPLHTPSTVLRPFQARAPPAV